MGKGVNTKIISFSADLVLVERMEELWGDRNRSEVLNAAVYGAICGDIDALIKRYLTDRAEWMAQAAKAKRAAKAPKSDSKPESETPVPDEK